MNDCLTDCLTKLGVPQKVSKIPYKTRNKPKRRHFNFKFNQVTLFLLKCYSCLISRKVFQWFWHPLDTRYEVFSYFFFFFKFNIPGDTFRSAIFLFFCVVGYQELSKIYIKNALNFRFDSCWVINTCCFTTKTKTI